MEEQFKEIKKIIVQFVWSGKKSRIAYSKLIQPYDQGGLKLVDIKAKNASLKAAWVHKIVCGDVKLELLKALLPNKSPEIWKCNIKPKDIPKVVQ